MNTLSSAVLSILGLALTCSSSSLTAQDIVTFTNGTRADADAVNANFQAVNNKATAAATVAAAAKAKADAAATQGSVSILSTSVANLTSAIAVTAPKVQLDRRLQFPNSPISNRTIVLYEGSNNDHQFYGFGISGNTLRHHVNSSADSHVFFAGASPTTSTELMRIQGNGNVGIGTNSPHSKLTIKTPPGSYGWVHEDGTLSLRSFLGQGTGYIGTEASASPDTVLYANGAQVRLSGAGRFGVMRAPMANTLEVEGGASKTTAGSWLANSDKRIKEDVQTIRGALQHLDRVRLVDFRYTRDYLARHPSLDDRRYMNVIAQEFAEVFPDHVKGSGEKLADGSEILQVDTSPLTIYTAAAVQELHRETQSLRGANEALAAENGELRGRLEALEAAVAQLQPAAAARK